MRKRNAIGISPSSPELTAGAIYFVFQLVLLPRFLQWLNPQLGQPLSAAELNFVFYQLLLKQRSLICQKRIDHWSRIII